MLAAAGRTLAGVRALLVFAAAVLVFHNLPALAGPLGDWIDLVTPFAVLGAAAVVLLVLQAPLWVAALALAAGIAYADGHGIHLAANSIRGEGLAGEAEDTAYFWDERFGHIEWHLGLLAILVAFPLAEWLGRGTPSRPSAAVLVVLMLGFTLFVNTVEGQDWWLLPPVALALAAWAFLRPRPVLRACAGAFVLAGILLAVWAAWQGGMPEFSDLGWI
jgi:hypothetical protein